MRINRQELLQRLEAVQAGLAAREVVEQSSCFVFAEGVVQTFNDRILCRQACPLDLTGAVAAAPLLAMLLKFPDEDVDILPGDGKLVVKGAGRKAEIRMESEVLLPVDSVEQPNSWRVMHEDFSEAVDLVGQCVGKSKTDKFFLTCIHIHPDFVEACDNIQAMRYPLPTGVAKPTIVPRDAMRHIVGLDMNQVAETKTWLHFRNPGGLILSIRRFVDEYPDLADVLLLGESVAVTLPGGLAEIVERADYFSSENAEQNEVLVELRPDKMRISGQGVSGRYEEIRRTKYEGDPIAFLIPPKLLTAISERHNEVEVGKEKLRVDTGRFVYISCLGDPQA